MSKTMDEIDVLMITGNRIMNDPELIERQLTEYIDEQVPDIAITGMAIGVDQVFARICLDSGIPVHAFLPFAKQDERWSAEHQRTYHSLLDRCDSVTTVCDSFSMQAYHIRNDAMLKAANRAAVVHDNVGRGTSSAIRLLKKKHVPFTVIQNKKR